ncbi:MAG: gliding motility-associated C-terminal domain-containing protein, partial [Saprospiraceae bacterium]
WQDNSTDPILSVTEQGTYWVEVAIGNCISVSNSIIIDFKDCNCNVYLPNVFTPNGDGKNDGYSFFFFCKLTDFHFIIFNCWGGVVYETNNYLDELDGTYKGRNMQSGVYAFKLNYKNIEGINQNINGSITLIR